MYSRARLLLLFLGVLLVHAPSFAQPTTVSFQGELTAQGARFDGTADFKFALLCGAASVWSNDGTSASGAEPGGAVSVLVDRGTFSVLLGDTALGMIPLTAEALASCDTALLRTWVDTGAGFEQLADQELSSSPFALQAVNAKRAPSGFVVNGQLQVQNAQGQSTVQADANTGEVSLTSLRFADGTVQTTAGESGAAPDGDWTLVGGDMYAGVPGFVGVGITTPDRKLHVTGGPDINSSLAGGGMRIGTATGQSLLFDENELQSVSNGATSSLGINVEGGNVGIGTVSPSEKFHVQTPVSVPSRMALRSGGSWHLVFEQDPESVFSIKNGGQQRLAIQPNGNLGIGTTTPSQRLEVAGSALVQGDLTVQGSLNVNGVALGSGIVAIPPNAFLPDDHIQTFKRSGLYYYGATAGGGVTIEAPVYLPHGATITEYTVVLTDNYSPVVTGSNIQTFLLRTPLNGSTGQILANRSTTGAPGRVTLTQTGLTHVVDNVNNVYYVAANWRTPASGGVDLMRHHGVVIRYTQN